MKFDIMIKIKPYGEKTLDYELIRSRRRSISAQILRDGSVVVRAPLFCSKTQIDSFLEKKRHLLEKYRLEVMNAPRTPVISKAEFSQLKKEAEEKILPRVEELSKKIGLPYEGAKITSARHRFGSCSGKNHLCFSAYLMLADDSEIDYVIIHELCHTKEHNHSASFYQLVAKFLPDWKSREKLLRKITIPEISDLKG